MGLLRATLLLGLALQTCGPRSIASSEPEAPVAGAPTRPHDPAPNPSTGCPDRFDYAMHGSTCEQGSVCSYPGAACECTPQFPCTGVDPGPAGQQPWFVWSCTTEDPSDLRGDGCPIRVPVPGQACTSPDQVCSYSPYCGGIQSTARCQSGAWLVDAVEISPPPSAEG